METDQHVAMIEQKGGELCQAIHDAQAAGVPDALVLPALISVFREAGMIPQDIDFGSLLGMLK